MFNFLLLIAIYLPFQLALSPLEGVDLASGRVLVIVLFLVWLATGLKKKTILFSPKITGGFLLTFLFLNIFSLVLAKNSEWSIRKIMFLASFIPLYFVAQALLNTKEKKEKLIQWLIYGAFASSVIGIIQFLAQFIVGRETVYNFWANYVTVPFLGKSFSEAVLKNPSWLVNISGETYLRATAFFPDPHMLAFFLGLIIPLAIGMLVLSSKHKFLNLLIVITLLIADGLTFSRGGYLGLVAGFLYLGIIFWQKIARKYKVATVGIMIGIILLGFIPSPINQRFQSIFNLREGSNLGRMETWKQAVAVVENHPWLGVGIGNYPLEIKPTASYREPIYAHNTYLDIAAETGVINTFLWIAFLVVTILGLYRSRNKLLVFASVSVVVFAVHSGVETGIYSATVLPILLIIASLNNEACHSREGGNLVNKL